jgi:hypothetical protein
MTVRELLDRHPSIGPDERHQVKEALEAGRNHGYGNVISWLATEWAERLVSKGLDKQTAINAVSNRAPYTLPK